MRLLLIGAALLMFLIMNAGCSHKRPMKNCDLVYQMNKETQQIEETEISFCEEQYQIWR